jgi:hypothetical protein
MTRGHGRLFVDVDLLFTGRQAPLVRGDAEGTAKEFVCKSRKDCDDAAEQVPPMIQPTRDEFRYLSASSPSESKLKEHLRRQATNAPSAPMSPYRRLTAFALPPALCGLASRWFPASRGHFLRDAAGTR